MLNGLRMLDYANGKEEAGQLNTSYKDTHPKVAYGMYAVYL
ncbi:hypothetical protein PRUB_a5349 [Pseudoalteromonas rubra]|uniref:Uncharacterized protein n=1 Tax=Pseudoalteromonas rubra TaxID=43658 RepID=A0A8T0CAF0_9GAMM|nr:hypothetical protein PRUB_a5349 [Pseudoalteromonas rubra]